MTSNENLTTEIKIRLHYAILDNREQVPLRWQYKHKAQIFKKRMGVKFYHIFLWIKVHERELWVICCKSAVAIFDMLTLFKWRHSLIFTLWRHQISKSDTRWAEDFYLPPANTLQTFINYGFLEDCINFLQVIQDLRWFNLFKIFDEFLQK